MSEKRVEIAARLRASRSSQDPNRDPTASTQAVSNEIEVGEVIAMEDNQLVINVRRLVQVQPRHASAAQSDATGTSTGDDGENRDQLNHPVAG